MKRPTGLFYFYQTMIDYITNTHDGCIIYQNQEKSHVRKSNLSILKRLCTEALFTYEGYVRSVRLTFKYHYKIPVYIDDCNIYLPTRRARDFDNIWINVAAIKDVSSNNCGIKINFYSGNVLYLKISLNSYKAQLRKIEQIRKTKVKHFH